MRCRRTRWTGWVPPPPRSPPGRRSSGTRSCPGPRPARCRTGWAAPVGVAPSCWCACRGGGYVPVIVVRHRITDPGGGAADGAPAGDRSAAGRPGPRTQAPHAGRATCCGWPTCTGCWSAAGWAPAPGEPFGRHGGVIGLDADVVVWHDLAGGNWPGEHSTLAEYDARFADRVAVATAAATGAPALARPSRIMECRRCPWWPTCEAELEREEDVSLVVRGDAATALRAAGSPPWRGWRRWTAPPSRRSRSPGSPFPDLVALARAWQRGLAVVRRVPRCRCCGRTSRWTSTWRASASPAPTCGARCSPTPAARGRATSRTATARFATWDPVPTPDEARSFAEFWDVADRGPRARAAATGRSSPRTATTSRRRTAGCSRRPGGSPACPGSRGGRRWRSSSPMTGWVDLFAVVGEWFLCAHGKGLKRIAPAAGFTWRDSEASGENSMRWYRDAVGMDGAEPDPAQRLRLLEYNADDVAATRALREWMTSRGRRGGAAGRRSLTPQVARVPRRLCGRSPRIRGADPLRRGCSVRGRDPKLFPGSRGCPARAAGGVGNERACERINVTAPPRSVERAKRGSAMSGCPFSGAAAAVGPESSAQTSVSRRRVLVGAAGLAAVPVLSGIGAPTAGRPGGPDTGRDTRTCTRTRAVRGAGQAQEGPGTQGCARRRRPAWLGHRAPVRPRPGGPLRRDVQAASGLQPAGCAAHRAGREDERRQGAPQRRQGQRRRVRQRDDAGRLHLLRPVRRPRHDARQDPAHPAEAGPAGDGQLRHPEVRPRQRLRQGPDGQPGALRPGQARIPAGQRARSSCSTCPATASAPPTSATRATTRTSSSRSCTWCSCACTTS